MVWVGPGGQNQKEEAPGPTMLCPVWGVVVSLRDPSGDTAQREGREAQALPQGGQDQREHRWSGALATTPQTQAQVGQGEVRDIRVQPGWPRRKQPRNFVKIGTLPCPVVSHGGGGCCLQDSQRAAQGFRSSAQGPVEGNGLSGIPPGEWSLSRGRERPMQTPGTRAKPFVSCMASGRRECPSQG